jgi:glycosyltransferase involved in cell wall biosynthesis
MRPPLLSVTITNYNYGKLIGRAIESVLQQSFEDFELLVSDNASTDESLGVIRDYAEQDSRIRVIARPENVGLARNLSRTTAEARGEFCVHLDADDWVLDRDAFKLQLEVLQRHDRASAVYSPVVLCDEAGRRVVISPHDKDRLDPGEVAVISAMKAYIVNSGPMFRMSAYRDFGGYNEEYFHALDIKLAIDLCGQGDVAFINRPLYGFFQHMTSLSRVSNVEEKQRDMVRAVESAFSGPLRWRIKNPAKVRHDALADVLTMHATLCVFNDAPMAGFSAFVSGVRIMPLVVLSNRRMFTLLARALMGGELYGRLRRMVEPFRAKNTTKVQIIPQAERAAPPPSIRPPPPQSSRRSA